MTCSPQQHGALAACVVLLAFAVGCREPDVSFGENVALRPREPSMTGAGAGAGAGASGASHDGGAGDAGVWIKPPALVPPALQPDDDSDASAPASDASVPTDAGDPDASEPDPSCPAIPTGLFDPEVTGDGSASGCSPMFCVSSMSIDGLPLHDIGLAFAVYDPTTFQGCTAILGDVIVHNYLERDLSPLSCLEAISGSLLILAAPSLQTLDGLDHLQHVSRNVFIGHASSFASDVSALTDLSGLSSLSVVLGSLSIRAPMLTSLDGLQALRTVYGALEIGDAASLYDLTGLSGLRAVGGRFAINGAPGLRELTGAESLETIGGGFYFAGGSGLRAFGSALPSVRCIGGGVEIRGPNPGLEELDLFPSLRQIGGDVSILVNQELQSIEMLSHVEHVGGSIWIQYNAALAQLDLSALERLGGVMVVTDNPQLEECPLIELAGELGCADGSQIHDNARLVSSGCPMLMP